MQSKRTDGLGQNAFSHRSTRLGFIHLKLSSVSSIFQKQQSKSPSNYTVSSQRKKDTLDFVALSSNYLRKIQDSHGWKASSYKSTQSEQFLRFVLQQQHKETLLFARQGLTTTEGTKKSFLCNSICWKQQSIPPLNLQ